MAVSALHRFLHPSPWTPRPGDRVRIHRDLRCPVCRDLACDGAIGTIESEDQSVDEECDEYRGHWYWVRFDKAVRQKGIEGVLYEAIHGRWWWQEGAAFRRGEMELIEANRG